uniref:hypothetical protein n=1 Tax=uncultured Erythrobacter sp. TaxID=263913 RepID=UPI00261A3212|nr:hypothetical protein [uncultured Erythrobacter sp.]
MRGFSWFQLAAISSAITLPSSLAAQVATPQSIVKNVCSDRTEESALQISRTRLAEEIFRSNKVYLSDLDPIDGTILQKLRDLRTNGGPSGENVTDERLSATLFSLNLIEKQLASDSLEGLTASGVSSRKDGWLFDQDSSTVQLTCKIAKTKTVVATLAAPPDRKRFSLREKPEELALTGKDRKAVSAFALGLDKKWTTDADGVENTETTLKFNGTAGARLTQDESPVTAYAFAQYNLKRVRKEPAPALAEGERRNKNDTDVLALGVSGDVFTTAEDGPSLWLTGQAAFVQDFVDQSERIRLSTKFDPGFSRRFGICGIGRMQYFGSSDRIGARCLVRLDTEIGIWTGNGISTTNSYDDFLAIGANLSYELHLKTGEKTGILASANYRYLPILSGQLSDIERLELALSHRIWSEGGLGIDLLTKYNNGTNALSLENEEDISLGVGLVF